MSPKLRFSFLFVLVLNLASVGYSEPGTIMLDFDKTGDVNTEPGFTSFLMLDSGTEINGITIDLAGDINDCRRSYPSASTGIPIYTEQIYRDFVYGVSPSGVTITLGGLGINQECDITIYAYDDESSPNRVSDWTANGDYLLTTDFLGGDPFLWPSPWWGIDYAFGPETATADEFGRIVLESTRNPASPVGEDFAFVNALVVAPKGTYIPTPYAQHPLPPDGGEDVPVDVNLEWKEGAYADTHDVYLGTDFNDVNDANRSNPPGVLVSQDHLTTTYNPPEFDFNTTYYWRIDEVNAAPDYTIFKGEVWSFTTHVPVLIAGNPVPLDGAQRVLQDVTLSWEKGDCVEKHDVYLGTSEAAVTDANRSNPLGVLVSQDHSTTTYDPPLDFNTTYYWRIDEVNAAHYDTIFKGNVWSFTTYEPTLTWRVDARCFLNGPPGAFDEISVKDPSIVYAGGKWHLFYTYCGGSCSYCMGYANATSIAGLQANHTSIQSSVAGNAPQVFWFEPQGKWYLIYSGPTFSTNTDINNPDGWTAGQSMWPNDGLDFWCISDGNNVYCFYSAQNGTVKRRSTTVANFPYGWSAPTIVATDTFEAPCVYKNIADGKFYMIVEDGEDVGRYYELWTADSPGGTWTKIEEQWAHKNKLVYFADHWTDQVSHGEIIRAGTNERMEISDINRCEILIQGVVDGDYGAYGNIPYDLGIIRQCIGAMGDLDYDYDVDFVDFAILASQWLQPQPPGVPSADIAQPGGDGIVDMQDLALLMDNWLWGK